jgi:ABC-2 type transport system ATP-binding protein
MKVLSLDSVSKHFGRAVALRELTLEVERGEVLGLLGPNGAGKTTTMDLACGVLSPTTGSVSLLGGDPRDSGVRARLGVMPQFAAAPEDLTVRELVRLWSAAYPHPLKEDEVFRRAGIGAFVNVRFGRLSGGQARRVAFGLAICGNPEVLLLDEPSTSLDADARRALWNELRSLAAAGATVVVSSHDLHEIESLATSAAVIAAGRLVFQGPISHIRRKVLTKLVKFTSQVPGTVVATCRGVAASNSSGGQHVVHTETPETFLQDLLGRATVANLEVSSASLEVALTHLLESEGSATS